MDNHIIVVWYKPAGSFTTRQVYQYDYGMIFQLNNFEELSDSFEMHFGMQDGTTVTQVGTNGQVTIPDSFLQNSGTLYCWLFLHEGANDGETRFVIRIPVAARSKITDEKPKPTEKSAITQAIAALNVAVEKTTAAQIAAEEAQINAETSAEEARVSAEGAEGYASQAEASAESASSYAESAQASATAASESEANASSSASSAITSATSASESKANAAESAEQAAASATNASVSAGQASASAAEAAGYVTSVTSEANRAVAARSGAEAAQSAAESAQTFAQSSAESANTSATSAAQSANAAAASQENAATYETNAALSATEAAGSATAAAASATQAMNSESTVIAAKDAAELAQNKAEESQSIAEQAAEDAENAKDIAVSSATSANSSASAAAESASSASSSASSAAESASNASQSADNAAGIATEAGQSASIASTKASEASASATNAANSAAAAASSESNAAASAEEANRIAQEIEDEISDVRSAIDKKLDAPSTAGENGQVLTSDGQGGQSWQTPSDDVVQDVQVNGVSVLQNGVANVPVASSSTPGVVIVNGYYGIAIGTTNNDLRLSAASSNAIKGGTATMVPIVPSNQHNATFYGLAKAAGDTTQSQSGNAVGAYTDEAKTAIQTMLDVPAKGDIPDVSIYATKADTVLETSLSRGRRINSSVGTWSIAWGNNVTANGDLSHAEGYNTSATGAVSFVFGKSNVEDSYDSWPEWVANTSYLVGDKIKITNGNTIKTYVCKEDNNDAEFTASKWTARVPGMRNYAEIVGNGELNALSNAYALDWEGNGHYMGDVYVHANADSTGGTKLATIEDIPDTSIYATKADTILTTTLSAGRKSDTTIGVRSLAFGSRATASGSYSQSLGYANTASANEAFAHGSNNTASAPSSHAEGSYTLASGNTSHAEGGGTIAQGILSHSEGQNSKAYGNMSHAEGNSTIANGSSSLTVGRFNIGDNTESWPEWTSGTTYKINDKVKVTTTVDNENTIINYICKKANNDIEFNIENWDVYYYMNYAHIVGNGTANNARSNAYALDWDGNGHYAGDVYVGANADSSGGERLAKESELGLKVVRLI